MPPEKIVVVYNAIDERFCGRADRGRGRARPRALSARSALRAVRRQHQAAQEPRAADRSVRRRCAQGELDDLKLLIIGDEISKLPALRRAVHSYKLHKHVRFLGFLPDDTLAVALSPGVGVRLSVAL